MSFYWKLRWKHTPEERKRIADGLIRLRLQLNSEQGIPAKSIEGSLLIASWNIREFDSQRYGPRCPDCFYYIAEIINHFDLVAIQEIREDLSALERVQDILGGWWKYLVTDVTYGIRGNQERLAFLYDSRKVIFGGLTGEIVLPDRSKQPAQQFARTPFICGFRAGWTKFTICTAHIYYGESKADDPRRIQEIGDLAEILRDQIAKLKQPDSSGSRNPTGENVILLGDFNVFDRQSDETFKALERGGFVVPPAIQRLKTNRLKNKDYDQIAFLPVTERFEVSERAGVFDFYQSVFRDADEPLFEKLRDGKARSYNEWKTYQMSDHLVLWTEIRTDFSEAYLMDLSKDPDAPADPVPQGTRAGVRRKRARTDV